MLLRWFPWKLIVSRVARARGLLDPVRILSRLESFGQPLEVKEPLELLRAGLVFHARGLLNTGAIQHNLDWIWPFWVERQYDPGDAAFIPRAFSITHVNLTHRNWTAVGLPGCTELPIVDPRGLLTPFWDSWSIDSWLVTEKGRWLIPSRVDGVEQRLVMEGEVAVRTHATGDSLELTAMAAVADKGGRAVCHLDLAAYCAEKAWLVVSLRPYNPEGVSFIHDIRLAPESAGWRVGRHRKVEFTPVPAGHRFSDYASGDVHTRLFAPDERSSVHCRVGMATAAALFAIEPGRTGHVRVSIPLEEKNDHLPPHRRESDWPAVLAGVTAAHLPDPHFQYLFEAAVRTLVLHSPGDVYPGPYTYKRFWFRDAAFILHALLCLGLEDRVEAVLDAFPSRQRRSGFFLSQEGEWDANGEALWILYRFCRLTGRSPKPQWRQAIRRGGHWLRRKRLSDRMSTPHAGLLPAGFSAEHLGPNDFYYWDDFWAVAGLKAAADMLEALGDTRAAPRFRSEADRFLAAIERSLAAVASRLGRQAMPASPYRRLDSGAIGSLAAGYPLKIFPPADPRLVDTAAFLLDRCLVKGGFYQDIIHSGINPYLSIHLAQVLLRSGDPRALALMGSVAAMASPTGQWPEAVHPRTGGGCMGDGQHAWAAAEWVLMLRNCFLREEGDRLVLASGILPSWLDQEGEVSFGPAPTDFGPVAVTLQPRDNGVQVSWNGGWRGLPPEVEVHLPGLAPVAARDGEQSVFLKRAKPP